MPVIINYLFLRGLAVPDMDAVVEFLDAALQIAVDVQKQSGPKLVDFKVQYSTL